MEASTYDRLASEYDAPEHKTSRNFDAATTRHLEGWTCELDGLVLEPGCGTGRVQNYLRLPSEQVVQLDSSMTMLSHYPRESSLLQVHHRAERLPFPSGTFDAVAGFLCDPFLGLEFLTEAQRVLKPGGLLIGTTPSFEWGQPLRASLGLDLMTTRFLLDDGETARAPSYLYPAHQLHQMIVHAGFPDGAVEVEKVCLPDDAEPVSGDIVAAAERAETALCDLPILYLFTAVAEG